MPKIRNDLAVVDSYIIYVEEGFRCSHCWLLFQTANAKILIRRHIRRHIEQGHIEIEEPIVNAGEQQVFP